MTRKNHDGRNIKRIREILGIKQDALAIELGQEWNQKKVSILEQKENIEMSQLEEVAKSLKIPVETIKTFNEENAVNLIASNHKVDTAILNLLYTFNPIDKWIEAIDKNEKLYERLLESEKEKIALMEGILNRK